MGAIATGKEMSTFNRLLNLAPLLLFFLSNNITSSFTRPPPSPYHPSSAKVVTRLRPLFQQQQQQQQQHPPIRLNKIFKATHSRREADSLIQSGRVTINNKPLENETGCNVIPFVDTVELDGIQVKGWEEINAIYKDPPVHEERPNQTSSQKSRCTFEYIKYWKPKGVITTTDLNIRFNIINELMTDGGYKPKHRVFPVGRLDKDTTGLILITSDGRLPNAVLRGASKQPKTYQVVVDRPVRRRDIVTLQNGITITTVAQRDNKRSVPLTAKTKPCLVHLVNPKSLLMTITEGRNRQIRKMMNALNYEVIRLHRVDFMGIGLDGLDGPGDWAYLDEREVGLVMDALKKVDAQVE